jgi:hypothetical protein
MVFDHARPIVRVDFLFPRQAFLLLPPGLFLYDVVYYGTVSDYPLILWFCSVFFNCSKHNDKWHVPPTLTLNEKVIKNRVLLRYELIL